VHPIKRILSTIDKDPIILSHHPLCGKFEDHVFKIRGRYMCIGCATVYPFAVVTVLLLLITNMSSFAIAFPIALSSFAVNLMRFLSKSHQLSLAFNAILGVSVGASLLSAVYAPKDIQLAVVLVGIAVAFSFSFLKGHRVLARCRSCQKYPEFPSCYDPRSLLVDECHQIQSEMNSTSSFKN
jgi:hypothetical protein